MRLNHLLKIDQKGVQFVVILLISLILTIPQISQQLLNDNLPATGDLIHRRAVYFLTNFPNFEAPVLVPSHSLFYHYLIADFNILTGFIGNLSFYGMSIINILMLPLAVLVILILARRINTRFALIGPLLFFGNPNLIMPFFGSSDQHLIYLFFGLFVFTVLNLQATASSKILAILFLGVTLNSSITIWLTLLLTLFLLEKYRESYKPLQLCLIAVIIYLPFLIKPLSYLALSKNFTPALLLVTLAIGLIALNLVYSFSKKYPSWRQYIFFYTGSIIATLFFVIKRGSGAFSVNLRPEQIESSKTTFLSSFNIVNNLFNINVNKGIAGFEIYVPIILLLLFLSITLIFRSKIKINNTLRLLSFIILIPTIIATLRLGLFALAYEYFVQTPLFQLHPGRIMSIAFFLLPLFFIAILPRLAVYMSRWVIIILMSTLIINVTFISAFASKRMYTNWTQFKYQQLIQNSLEQGLENNLSTAEARYACHYYNHCTLQTPSDIQF